MGRVVLQRPGVQLATRPSCASFEAQLTQSCPSGRGGARQAHCIEVITVIADKDRRKLPKAVRRLKDRELALRRGKKLLL